MLNPFRSKEPEPETVIEHFSMTDLLANATMADDVSEAHAQLSNFQREIGDRIARANHREAELTKQIDFLNEERRQIRVIRQALEMSLSVAQQNDPAISLDTFEAELAVNYG